MLYTVLYSRACRIEQYKMCPVSVPHCVIVCLQVPPSTQTEDKLMFWCSATWRQGKGPTQTEGTPVPVLSLRQVHNALHLLGILFDWFRFFSLYFVPLANVCIDVVRTWQILTLHRYWLCPHCVTGTDFVHLQMSVKLLLGHDTISYCLWPLMAFLPF